MSMTERGHKQPLFDNTSEANLFTGQLPERDTPELPLEPGPARELDQGTRKSLAEIALDHKQRQQAYAARWEELTDSNWPPGRIAEMLDKEFPDLRTPERIEELEKRQLADMRRQAIKTAQPRKRRSPAQNPGIRRLPGYDRVIPPEAR